MSVNTPPTENIPIFDPSVFPSASGTALTIASGSKYFLNYPVAQGSEIFPSNVTLQSTLTDRSGDVGTAGQVLSSTGTGTNWVNNSSNNNTINYNTSSLPFTLPIPTQANTYYTFTGTTPAGGILTIPISGITTGTYIYIKNASGTVGINISTTYIKFQGSTTTTTLRSVQTGKGIALYFNGSYWIETQFTDFAENIFISNTTSTGTLATNSLTKSFSYGAGDPMVIWNDVTQSDISIGNTLPAPYTVRIANTTSGSSGGSVHCANVGFDGSHINNATDPTGASGGNLKLGQLLTSGPLYIGGGANTAVHTTGPIIIGSDSTASGGINIGTGTNQTVPTVNTVNIGSATYATNVLGTFTSNSLNALTAGASQTIGGNITSGSITIGGALSTGSITLAGVQTTGDINIGSSNATCDIYIGNGTNSTTGANRGICSVNKLQVGNTTTGNGVGTGTPFRCMIIGRDVGSTSAATGTITIAGAPTGAGNPIVFASLNITTTSNPYFITVNPTGTNTFQYYKTFYNRSGTTFNNAIAGATGETFNYVAIWL